MFSTRVLLLLVLISCAYGHKKVQNDKKHNDHNVGITGGHKVPIEQIPFIVSLRLYGIFHWCGGSIIHERFILTAAHCIKPGRVYKVLVGTDKVDEGGKLYDVEKIIPHEKYSSRTSDYDICILKLKESLTFGPAVAKVLLTGNIVKLKKGTLLNTTGWGNEYPTGPTSKYLQQTTVPVVPLRQCIKSYRVDMTRRMMCAGSVGKDACMGDSGGPLTWNNVQVGITSFGGGCGLVPGVYTKISALKQWIKNTVKNHHKKEERERRARSLKKSSSVL